MNRLLIAIAILSLASAGRAQETTTAPAAAPAADTTAPAAPDTADQLAKLEGKLTSLEEQYAETRNDVAGLKRLKFSGYIQARWAKLGENVGGAGEGLYSTTPEKPPAQNGFFIRRGRIKAVYDADLAQFVLQLDATPSGVSIKEGYATVKIPNKLIPTLAVDAGLQLFPFGYEISSRSSSDLDTLERARVTRAFAGGEYDLGVSLRGARGPIGFRVGVFNGNGVDAKTSGLDNDQYKDVIGRVTYDAGGFLTVGASGWYGKIKDAARTDGKTFTRERVAVDAQLYLDLLPIGGTALKGEYMWGKATIGDKNGGAGGNLPAATATTNVPTGSGYYAILTQNLGKYNQLAVKWESYMPDHTVDLSGDTNNMVMELRELQLALHTYVGGNYKLTGAWFHPMNGKKGAAAKSDPKQDQFIVQAQAKF
jgi:hypothetical protein